MRSKIILFDPSTSRRAMLTLQLSARWHVEPYGDLDDLRRFRPRDAAFALVRDERDLLDEVRTALEDSGEALEIVAFAENPGTEAIVAAIKGGCTDYLDLERELAQIDARLAPLLAGNGEDFETHQRRVEARLTVARLTDREISIGGQIAGGRSNKAIAAELGISPRTVEVHRANLLRKLGVNNAVQAVRILLDGGAVS